MSVTLDLNLMSTALRFWSKDLNSFIFLFGPTSITLRNISIFIGLPVEGSEAVCLLDAHDPLLPHLEDSSTSQTSYSPAIRKWQTSTGVPSTPVHIEFLWVLLFRFVFLPHSGKPSIEYLPMAKALAIGRPYALGTILLASLYQSMGKYVSEIPYQRVGGVLWFIQIWLFAYFPELSDVDSFPSMSLGLSATQSIRTISSNSLSSFFLRLADVKTKLYDVINICQTFGTATQELFNPWQRR